MEPFDPQAPPPTEQIPVQPPTWQPPTWQAPAWHQQAPTAPPYGTAPPPYGTAQPPYGTVPALPSAPPPPGTHRAPSASQRGLIAICVVIGMAISGGIFGAVGAWQARHDTATSPIGRAPSVTVPDWPFGNGNQGNGNQGNGNQGRGPNTGSGDTPPGSSGGSGSIDAAAIADKVEPGVVDIDTVLGYRSAKAAGTGMVLTSSGQVLTNNHVIAGATKITATSVTTGKRYEAKVVGVAPREDVAVLQLVGASGLDTVQLGDPDQISPGDPVVAIGNAGGRGGAPSVSPGVVTALDRTITASDASGGSSERLDNLIQIDANIRPGDSGGPLADADGKVIGMNTAASVSTRFESATNEGYAIAIDDAMAIVRQIESGKETATVHIGTPGIMGVEVAPASGFAASAGATIAGVSSGSPADRAGIEVGDVIVAIDGNAVATPEALSEVMRRHHAGDRVRVEWTDAAGQRRSASLTLIEGPAI